MLIEKARRIGGIPKSETDALGAAGARAVILAVVDEVVRRHLLAAVTAHRAALRRDGVSTPTGLRELAAALATDGQGRPSLDTGQSGSDDQPMDVLALDYRAAGARIGTSDRTVRRLVRDGILPVVEVAGCKRIRTDDLEAYVAGLPVVNQGDAQTTAGEAETPAGVDASQRAASHPRRRSPPPPAGRTAA